MRMRTIWSTPGCPGGKRYLLMACIGGACGLGLATVGVHLFAAWNPLDVLPAVPIAVDVRSLIGVRRAPPGRVRLAVTTRTLLFVVVGAMSGCAAAVGLGTALEAVLYGIRPADLVSFLAALASLLMVAVGAAFAAALRATRIRPVDVLRGN